MDAAVGVGDQLDSQRCYRDGSLAGQIRWGLSANSVAATLSSGIAKGVLRSTHYFVVTLRQYSSSLLTFIFLRSRRHGMRLTMAMRFRYYAIYGTRSFCGRIARCELTRQ